LVKPRCLLQAKVIYDLIQDEGGASEGYVVDSSRQNAAALLLFVVVARVDTVLVVLKVYLVRVFVGLRSILDFPLLC
jgi:hypothetical protein